MSAMPNISVSRGQWDQIPRFVARRRPGGGAPDRLDTTSTSPATELDIALGFTIHDDHHDDDDDFSIGSPSVATAVTANISPVTPDDDNRRPPPLEDDGRGGRDRTDHGSGRDTRRRRHRGKNIASREPPPPPGSPHLATGGGKAPIREEIRGSMRDVTDSVRQIFTTVQRFGPDERDAVRETLLDARDYITEKVGTSLFSCGRADVDDDGSPVRDARDRWHSPKATRPC